MDTWQLKQFKEFLKLELSLAHDLSYIQELRDKILDIDEKIRAFEMLEKGSVK